MQVLYKNVRGGWGSEVNAYFAYVVRGVGWGVERQNAYAYIAYVKDQTSYSPENGFKVCKIFFNS